MKKILIFIILSIVIIILGIVLIYLIYGTPWGKAEAKEKAQEYLNTTYSQKMIINNDVEYDIEGNQYLLTAYPVNNKEIKFLIYISKRGDVWKDEYYLSYFSYELGKEANEYSKRIFGEESRAYTRIDGGTIDNYNILNLNESTKLEDVIDKFDRKYRIGLVISGDFTNSSEEVEKLYKFVSYVKSLQYKPNRFYFTYYKGNSDDTNFYLPLEEKEYQSITCPDDLLQYINEEINSQ